MSCDKSTCQGLVTRTYLHHRWCWWFQQLKQQITGNSWQIKTTTAATTLCGGAVNCRNTRIILYTPTHHQLSKALARHAGTQWKCFTSLEKGVRTPIAIIGHHNCSLDVGSCPSLVMLLGACYTSQCNAGLWPCAVECATTSCTQIKKVEGTFTASPILCREWFDKDQWCLWLLLHAMMYVTCARLLCCRCVRIYLYAYVHM